jgi:hypothetical protein
MILKDMRFAVNDSQLRVLFNMVDLSGNGSISKAEFIQGFYTLMRQLVPNIILHSLSVLPEQIASHILKALMFLLLLFAFLFVSMDALTPSSAADVDFMGGVQAVVQSVAGIVCRARAEWTYCFILFSFCQRSFSTTKTTKTTSISLFTATDGYPKFLCCCDRKPLPRTSASCCQG